MPLAAQLSVKGRVFHSVHAASSHGVHKQTNARFARNLLRGFIQMSKKFTTALGAAFAVVLVTAIGAFAAVTAGNTGWHWGNPLPQGNTLTTLDNVGDRVYAGGATGTLVRSSDAGASWTGVRTGLLDDIRLVRAMSADSFVFASTCALRRSDDGGATVRRLTWSP